MATDTARDTTNQTNHSTFQQWAIRYAANGWAVFPLTPRDKAPIGALVPNGFHDASTAEPEIRAWFAQEPQANIGVAVPEGYIVLDVDVHGVPPARVEAEAKRRLEQLRPTPQTVIARTGSGGYHLWFRIPAGVTLTGNRFETLEGIEYKVGGKGYVVVAPSIHPSGGRYEWLQPPFGNVPIAELPAHLVTLAQAKKPQSERAERNERAAPDEPIPEGQRQETLFREACALRARGVGQDAIAAHLRDVNERRCNPPMPYSGKDAFDPEAMAARVCARYEAGSIDAQRAAGASQQQQARGPMERIERFDGAALWSASLPETRWAIPGLLPEGNSLLAARPKAGKTFLMLGLGLAVATGGKALGVAECEPGHVLYLALEDNQRRLQARMKQLLANRRPERLDITFQLKAPRLDQGLLADLRSYLDERPDTRLIVVDTLAKVKPPSKSKSAYDYLEDYAAIDQFTQLANERHVAIVVIHHSRKTQGEHAVDDVSGTSGLTGAADAIIVLRAIAGTVNTELSIDSRDIEPTRYTLERDPDTAAWKVVGEGSVELRMTSKQAAVVAYLRAQGASAAETLWQAMRPKEARVDKDTLVRARNAFDKLLRRMLVSGALIKRDRGQYDLAPNLRRERASERESDCSEESDASDRSDASDCPPTAASAASDVQEGQSDQSDVCSDGPSGCAAPMDSGFRPQSDQSDASDYGRTPPPSDGANRPTSDPASPNFTPSDAKNAHDAPAWVKRLPDDQRRTLAFIRDHNPATAGDLSEAFDESVLETGKLLRKMALKGLLLLSMSDGSYRLSSRGAAAVAALEGLEALDELRIPADDQTYCVACGAKLTDADTDGYCAGCRRNSMN